MLLLLPVVPSLYDLLLRDTIEYILKNVTLEHIDFLCMDKKLETFPKISSFMVHRRKKGHTGLK